MRLDAATTTKSAKSYQDLKCKIEQCGGRCLRGGETCRLVPDAVQQKIWMGALKKVGKAPVATSSRKKKAKVTPTGKSKPKEKAPVVTEKPLGAFLTEADAGRQFPLLGSGISGNVYLDAKNNRALKYFENPTIELDDEFINQLKTADKLGVGPKFFGHDRVETGTGQTRAVMSMEYLDGYEVGVENNSESRKDFLRKLKKVHDAGLVLGDLHEENVMSNAKTNEVKFIDISFGENATWEEKAEQLLDRYSWRPMGYHLATQRISEIHKKDRKKQTEFKKLAQKIGLRKSADVPLTEVDYEKITKRAYELLELDK